MNRQRLLLPSIPCRLRRDTDQGAAVVEGSMRPHLGLLRVSRSEEQRRALRHLCASVLAELEQAVANPVRFDHLEQRLGVVVIQLEQVNEEYTRHRQYPPLLRQVRTAIDHFYAYRQWLHQAKQQEGKGKLLPSLSLALQRDRVHQLTVEILAALVTLDCLAHDASTAWCRSAEKGVRTRRGLHLLLRV